MAQLKRDLAQAVKERDIADRKIERLTAAIGGLAGACEDPEEQTRHLEDLNDVVGRVGFRDAILRVLGNHSNMSAVEIKDAISVSGWINFADYSNPMASIHTTLRRLKESGKVEVVESADGEKGFRLNGPSEASMRLAYKPKTPNIQNLMNALNKKRAQ